MHQLPFLSHKFAHEHIRNFWELKEHGIPEVAGVYILLAADGFTFPYPRQSSSVFYIGQATNLRKRLYTHLRFARQARDDRRETLYWPRYEYAAAFGGFYTWMRTKGIESPKFLEEEVLCRFAEQYRSWPVANGMGAWQGLLPREQAERYLR
jgi:hypothetical protein